MHATKSAGRLLMKNVSFAVSVFATLGSLSAMAHASEAISPSYLWNPVSSFSLSRVLICGDRPEKIEWRRGEQPKGPRIAIYRNMSSQYFATRDEPSLVYDQPLGMDMVEDNDKFQKIVFSLMEEGVASKPYAEIKIVPHSAPTWVRFEGKKRIEEKCRGYRFEAEFIHRGG